MSIPCALPSNPARVSRASLPNLAQFRCRPIEASRNALFHVNNGTELGRIFGDAECGRLCFPFGVVFEREGLRCSAFLLCAQREVFADHDAGEDESEPGEQRPVRISPKNSTENVTPNTDSVARNSDAGAGSTCATAKFCSSSAMHEANMAKYPSSPTCPAPSWRTRAWART